MQKIAIHFHFQEKTLAGSIVIIMITNQVDERDKVAKEGAGKSKSPHHKPGMKAASNNEWFSLIMLLPVWA